MYQKTETLLCRQRSIRSSYGLSRSHVRMWELDHKEGWVLKNWNFRTEVLEKTLESRSDSNDTKLVIPKENIHWFWSWSSNTLATWCEEMTQWKRSWCWKDWGRQEQKWVTEGEMVGWHHWLNGHEFNQILENGKEQGSPWHPKESDTTYGLNNSNTKKSKYL